MQPAASIAGQIVAILSEAPNHSLLGSKLSALVKFRAADFEPLQYGARNLREFVKTHVPQVYESSRQGLDVIYSLSPVQPEVQQPALPEIAARPVSFASQAKQLDDELWKTFVSPSGPYRLFVNPGSRQFRVVGLRDETPSSPWVQVPPCSAARHKSIAEEFVASLDNPDNKANLALLLKERIWWIPFFDRTRQLGIEKEWLDFRRSALFEELRRTLSTVGVENADPAVLAPEGGERVRRSFVEHPTRAVRGSSDLRALALALVRRVDDSELRELRFRLGDIVEALSIK